MIRYTITLSGLDADALSRLLAAMSDSDGTHILEEITITPEEVR